MATLKPACSLREEDAGRPDRVEDQEPAGRHEGEREEQDARVAASVGRLARGVAEDERDRADDPEDDEVRAVVLEVRVELRAQQQRDEPDERQRSREQRATTRVTDRLDFSRSLFGRTSPCFAIP